MNDRYMPSTPWQRTALRMLLDKRTDLTQGTAQQLFEGTLGGDAAYLVDRESLELGMWPFREIHDHSVHADNGDVPVYFGHGRAFLAPETPVLFLSAYVYEARTRLDPQRDIPKIIDLDDDNQQVGKHEDHGLGGQLLVVERYLGDPSHLICWRRDGRMRKDILVLSGHSSEEFAFHRMHEVAEEFEPGRRMERGRQRGIRDHQREKLYDLEGRVGSAGGYRQMTFETIPECKEFLAGVYEEMGLGDPPPVKLGPRNTTTSFYRMRDGITLAKWGMERWTLLHEAAHHIARMRTRNEPSHGPTFVGILAEMLERHAGIEKGLMGRMADEQGVEWTPMHIEPGIAFAR